jgi:hypothetical protein
MQFNKYDLQQLENIMRALRGGAFTMQGLEILAFSDCMKWASRLQEIISKQIIADETKAAMASPANIPSSPFKESPIKTDKEIKPIKKKK